MSGFDFARYTPQQIEAHCQNNARSLSLNPNGYQAQQRDALGRAERLEAQAHAEAKAFRVWRVGFIVPRREAWATVDAASNEARQRATQEVLRLRTAWAALYPLLTPEEREQWLSRPG
ncbi:hypothetical protein [Luteibacter sp.]|jgi:hypothetical protein|uniref:hypothetical protein n=1 Tax=Luteibacter sp. TaxID=1886636 RepID=UPI002F41524A